jgi:hypothetical protein
MRHDHVIKLNIWLHWGSTIYKFLALHHPAWRKPGKPGKPEEYLTIAMVIAVQARATRTTPRKPRTMVHVVAALAITTKTLFKRFAAVCRLKVSTGWVGLISPFASEGG